MQDECLIYKNVYLYTSRRVINGVFDGGVYDSNGNAITEFNLVRNNKYCTDLDEKKKDLSSIEHKTISYGIFGGYIFSHFGHFLVESLNRFYSYKFGSEPIIFISPTPSLSKYQKKIFELLGIEKRIYLVSDLLEVSRLAVYPVGYRIPDFYENRSFFALGVYSQKSDYFQNKKVWMSRSKLKYRYIRNETLLENKLRSLGWLVIYPEELDLEQQLQIFTSAKQVAGFSGSAFHLAILCKTVEARFDIFMLNDRINKNFLNIADAKMIKQYTHDVGLKPQNNHNYISCFWELSTIQINKIQEKLE